MKPFRKNVALAVDGGGIRGVMVARALAMLEEHLGKPCHDVFRLTAGTSTGAIISAGAAVGLSAARMFDLYCDLGSAIFRQTLRSRFWLLARSRYPGEPLEGCLRDHLGSGTVGDLWSADPPTDVVITAFDVTTNHTCFIKPYKEKYRDWPLAKAVLASCTIPTYFPPVDGRYVDGGVGSYANPCYLAAYESRYRLGWDPEETTIISLGTGRVPCTLTPDQVSRFRPWDWIVPILGAFIQSSDDQQAHLVRTFFERIDFRRFQVEMGACIESDEVDRIPELAVYGDQLGEKILNDDTDPILEVMAQQAIGSE